MTSIRTITCAGILLLSVANSAEAHIFWVKNVWRQSDEIKVTAGGPTTYYVTHADKTRVGYQIYQGKYQRLTTDYKPDGPPDDALIVHQGDRVDASNSPEDSCYIVAEIHDNGIGLKLHAAFFNGTGMSFKDEFVTAADEPPLASQ